MVVAFIVVHCFATVGRAAKRACNLKTAPLGIGNICLLVPPARADIPK